MLPHDFFCSILITEWLPENSSKKHQAYFLISTCSKNKVIIKHSEMEGWLDEVLCHQTKAWHSRYHQMKQTCKKKKSVRETIFFLRQQMYCLARTDQLVGIQFWVVWHSRVLYNQTEVYPSESMVAYHLASENFIFCWIWPQGIGRDTGQQPEPQLIQLIDLEQNKSFIRISLVG